MTFLESLNAASGRAAAVTNAATASVCSVLVSAVDASYEILMNVLVTTSTTHTFTCECAYTDESNAARIITMQFNIVGATTALTSSIAASAAVPYHGVPLLIRCKAGTTITLRTQAAGTYTTVVYNVEGWIQKMANW